MTITIKKFVEISGLLDEGELQKIVLFTYFCFRNESKIEFSKIDILNWFSDSHLHQPNISRVMTNISRSPIFAKGQEMGFFKLHARELRILDDNFSDYFEKTPIAPLKNDGTKYVHAEMVRQLAAINSDQYDLLKLIRLCEELNLAHANEAIYSCAMLLRGILDHVPPVFECKSFAEVANNYGSSRSFKKSVKYLHESSRNIADQFLHTQVRRKEAVPTAKQVDYSNDLDLLLSEVVRILK